MPSDRGRRFLIWILGGWFWSSLLFFGLIVALKVWLQPTSSPQASVIFSGFPPERQRLALQYTRTELLRNLVLLFHYLQVAGAAFAVGIFYYNRLTPTGAGVALVVALGLSGLLSWKLLPQWASLAKRVALIVELRNNPQVQEFTSLQTFLVLLQVGLLILLLYAAVALITANPQE